MRNKDYGCLTGGGARGKHEDSQQQVENEISECTGDGVTVILYVGIKYITHMEKGGEFGTKVIVIVPGGLGAVTTFPPLEKAWRGS